MPGVKPSTTNHRAISGSCSNGSRARAAAQRQLTQRSETEDTLTTMTIQRKHRNEVTHDVTNEAAHELTNRPARERAHELRVGLVSISDRASTGAYADQGIPALQDWLGAALASPWRAETR